MAGSPVGASQNATPARAPVAPIQTGAAGGPQLKPTSRWGRLRSRLTPTSPATSDKARPAKLERSALYSEVKAPVREVATSLERRQLVGDARLASYAYTRDPSLLETTSNRVGGSFGGTFKIDSGLAQAVVLGDHDNDARDKSGRKTGALPSSAFPLFGSNRQLPLDSIDTFQGIAPHIDDSKKKSPPHGGIIDPKSGLTCFIAVNETTKEIKVIFGGTTSGLTASDSLMERSWGNRSSGLAQWKANLRGVFGEPPKSYRQAACIVRGVAKECEPGGDYAGYTVSTVGHSKGAGEAVFAALAQTPKDGEKPIAATGFSSAHLGKTIVKMLPRENLAQAHDRVTHLHVAADPVPNYRYLNPRVIPIGQEMSIPAKGLAPNPVQRHDGFLEHIEAHLW